MKKFKSSICIICIIVFVACSTARKVSRTDPGDISLQPAQLNDTLKLADPTIFYNEGSYYLYGTGGDVRKGFLVYTSTSLQNWKGPLGATAGYALVTGDSYGTAGFWAPQVFKYNNKFYMAYTANENIAIAESNHPLGPFKQKSIHPISGQGKQIDPYVFFDPGGKIYLYHVRLTEGNRIFVAQLKDDLSDINTDTIKECISGTETWENTQNTKWPVTEGPTVLKHKNLYYLFYSANDFRNIDYAVGYATSDNPFGPWKKYNDNPILSRKDINQNGTGHGDFVNLEKNQWYYVFHTHNSPSSVSPRKTAAVKAKFVMDKRAADKMVMDGKSFHFLMQRK